MTKKQKTVFVCQECGYESPKWMGQCVCGAWNSMVEEHIRKPEPTVTGRRSAVEKKKAAGPQKIIGISAKGEIPRLDTGLKELNRVMGGGLVNGSMTLISGEPGIGKSTIIMQAAQNIAAKYGNVLYVTGEESEEQVAMRAERICKHVSQNIFVLAETNMDVIYDTVEELKPVFLVIDSIQTIYAQELESAPGSVSQVRTCGNHVMRIAKGMDIPTFLVAHVTKSGELAGPKTVEHMVDCVLHLTGERNREMRVLRAFKNRFGTTSEIGIFEMTGEGLQEVQDLSSRFLQETDQEPQEGSVITAVYEGSRPLLMEVQALAVTTHLSFPRRTAVGIDSSRLNMLLAVLERKAQVPLTSKDVYVNVAGGLRLEGTSADLAVALAVHSSVTGKVSMPGTLVLGEVGLTGEIRHVANADKIISEAVRMGFKKIIVPKNQLKNGKIKSRHQDSGVKIIGVATIAEAVTAY